MPSVDTSVRGRIAATVRDRVDPAPLTALVALGDLACIAAFVVVGSVFGHGEDLVADAPRIASTFGTFAAGWLPASFVGRLYAADVRASPRSVAARTIPAWIGAAVVAQLLRSLPSVPGNAAVTFFLVSVGVGLALLLPWRVGVAVYADEN